MGGVGECAGCGGGDGVVCVLVGGEGVEDEGGGVMGLGSRVPFLGAMLELYGVIIQAQFSKRQLIMIYSAAGTREDGMSCFLS